MSILNKIFGPLSTGAPVGRASDREPGDNVAFPEVGWIVGANVGDGVDGGSSMVGESLGFWLVADPVVGVLDGDNETDPLGCMLSITLGAARTEEGAKVGTEVID